MRGESIFQAKHEPVTLGDILGHDGVGGR